MKTFKIFFLALAVTFSSSIFAAPERVDRESRKIPPITLEIEKMLRDSNLIIEDEFMVTVIFEVTAEKRIQVKSIKSPNQEVSSFLEKRLRNRKLHGDGWYTQKVYELPVKVQAMR